MDAKFYQSSRKSIRLRYFDYSAPGKYFVTVCCRDRKALLGEICAGVMTRSRTGDAVAEFWNKIEEKFSSVTLEDFIVMPNHVHGIVCLAEAGGHPGPPLHKVVAWWKTMSSNWYFRNITGNHGPLWQRSYHDRVIRNEAEYLAIADYIRTNPLRWELDKYHV